MRSVRAGKISKSDVRKGKQGRAISLGKERKIWKEYLRNVMKKISKKNGKKYNKHKIKHKMLREED